VLCVNCISQSKQVDDSTGYSQADEDRSSLICCPCPQTINRNCGSIEDETCLNPDTRDCWWQTGYDNWILQQNTYSAKICANSRSCISDSSISSHKILITDMPDWDYFYIYYSVILLSPVPYAFVTLANVTNLLLRGFHNVTFIFTFIVFVICFIIAK